MGIAKSQQHREKIRSSVTKKIFAMRNVGRSVGPVPFGFDVGEDQLLRPNKREQLILQMIETGRNQGESFSAIARDLNTKKIPTKRGSQWCATSVRKVLKTSAKYAHIEEVHGIANGRVDDPGRTTEGDERNNPSSHTHSIPTPLPTLSVRPLPVLPRPVRPVRPIDPWVN